MSALQSNVPALGMRYPGIACFGGCGSLLLTCIDPGDEPTTDDDGEVIDLGRPVRGWCSECSPGLRGRKDGLDIDSKTALRLGNFGGWFEGLTKNNSVERLKSVGEMLFGAQWQTRFAEISGYSPRSVRLWIANNKVPKAVMDRLPDLILDVVRDHARKMYHLRRLSQNLRKEKAKSSAKPKRIRPS